MGLTSFIIGLNNNAVVSIPIIGDETTWFVSSSGSPSNDGHSPDHPITYDVLLTKTIVSGDKIYFNRGDNFIVSDFEIGVDNIEITDYGTGADPIIQGSTNISTATWTNEGSGIWSTPSAAEVKWLFINGQAARMGESDWIPYTSAPSSTTRGANTATLNAFNSVQSLVGCKFRYKMFNFRLSFEETITAYNSGTGVLTKTGNFVGGGVNYPMKLYGQLQFVTQNGDWYWDDAANKLYVKSAATPAGTDIRATYADNAFFAQSKSNIIISNLEFRHYYRAPIEAQNCDDLTLSNIYSHDSRTWGALVYGNSDNLSVEDLTIERCGYEGFLMGAIASPTFNNLIIEDIDTQPNYGWPIDTRFRAHCGFGLAVTDEPTETYKVPNTVTISNFLIRDVGNIAIAPYGDDWLIEYGEVDTFATRWDDVGGIHSYYNTATFGAGSTANGIIHDVIVHGGVGSHEGIASYTAPDLVAGVYLDNGSFQWEVYNVTSYDNVFGFFVNWNTEQNNFHDCVAYDNSIAQMCYVERPNVSDSPEYLHNYGNKLNDCVLVALATQLHVMTRSQNTGADANYNPYASGGESDNNYFISPYVSTDSAVANHATTTSFTGGTNVTFAQWKTRTGQDAASVQKAFYLAADGPMGGLDETILIPNPTDSSIFYDLTDGAYTNEASSNINDVTVPAWGSKVALLKASYYYLLDGFDGAGGSTISGRTPLSGGNAVVVSGTHTLNGSSRMQSSVEGLVSWNIGQANHNYELLTVLSNTSSAMRMDVRLGDDSGSANNRIILDFTGGNARLREFFASASATQTKTTAFALAVNPTFYRIRIQSNGSAIKIFISTSGAAEVQLSALDMTTSLLTGTRVGIFGQTTRTTTFVAAYPL